MHRLAARILGLALCTTALCGCSMLGGDDSISPSRARATDAADSSPMAPDIDTNIRQVQSLRAKGDVSGATRIMSQLMLVYPDDARVVGEYGKLLVQMNQPSDAIQFLHRAIQLQPNDWSFYSALGVAYDQASDPANAKLAYERALALKPGEAAILNNFAMSRMLARDTASARTLLLQAKAAGGDNPKIEGNLALLDRMAPAIVPAAATPAAPAPDVAVAPRKPVARADAPPAAAPAPATKIVVVAPTAKSAPTPLVRSGVMMQSVPADTLAGPIVRNRHGVKPAKVANAATRITPTPVKTAKPAASAPAERATAAVKPPAKVKPLDHIPSLRMTADAGKP
jgi:Flp pilus assembly protein TadD